MQLFYRTRFVTSILIGRRDLNVCKPSHFYRRHIMCKQFAESVNYRKQEKSYVSALE